MTKIIKAFLFIVVATGFLWVVNVGLTKYERLECLEWARQAEEFQGFYLAGWQEEQCRAVFKTSYTGDLLLKRMLAGSQEN